jgi:RNA polymerase sigma factor (sigma-70 family)
MPATPEQECAVRAMDDVEARADGDLLRAYAEAGDEAAFVELVGRHWRWVYASALRQVRDATDAEDVAQAVFAALGRKAGTLRRETILAGWLFRAARYAAIDMIRAKQRRIEREQVAYANAAQPDENARWEEMEPVIDECLSTLRARDQRAILLRFYQQKGWREIGEALGSKENTARVRVERALMKLRGSLTRRGVRGSAAGFGVLLLAHAGNSARAIPNVARETNVAGLVRTISWRFWIGRARVAVGLALLAAALIIAGESYRRIPLSQSLPERVLVGEAAFAALVDLDRAFIDGDVAGFMRRIHFRNATDLKYRDALEVYLRAAAEFRAAGAARFRNRMFGYYAALDGLMLGRERPTLFGREGKHATAKFARRRGLHLIKADGEWKWNFFAAYDDAQWAQRFAVLKRKTASLRDLSARLKNSDAASEAEILAELFAAK